MPVTPTTPATQKYLSVAKPEVDKKTLQQIIDYACGQGVYVSPIQPGGACFNPNTIAAHATFAMNAFYQESACNNYDFYFRNTTITQEDPSMFFLLSFLSSTSYCS